MATAAKNNNVTPRLAKHEYRRKSYSAITYPLFLCLSSLSLLKKDSAMAGKA
jgi:hypothetical protein